MPTPAPIEPHCFFCYEPLEARLLDWPEEDRKCYQCMLGLNSPECTCGNNGRCLEHKALIWIDGRVVRDILCVNCGKATGTLDVNYNALPQKCEDCRQVDAMKITALGSSLSTP